MTATANITTACTNIKQTKIYIKLIVRIIVIETDSQLYVKHSRRNENLMKNKLKSSEGDCANVIS